MGHLLKIKCVHSRVNVHILASTSVPFTLTTVQGPVPGPTPVGGDPVPGPAPVGGGAVPGPAPMGGGPVPGPAPMGEGPVPGPAPVGGDPVPGPAPVGGGPVPGPVPVGGGPVFSVEGPQVQQFCLVSLRVRLPEEYSVARQLFYTYKL
jgi:hypothetical protein